MNGDCTEAVNYSMGLELIRRCLIWFKISARQGTSRLAETTDVLLYR
jgi:hypothetical protein